MKRRNKIISKVKPKYWTLTHKYEVRIPKSVKEAISPEKLNGNTLWWEAIVKETKILITF